MNYIFMGITGICFMLAGLALWFDADKPAAWFFIAACIFTLGI